MKPRHYHSKKAARPEYSNGPLKQGAKGVSVTNYICNIYDLDKLAGFNFHLPHPADEFLGLDAVAA